MKKNTQSSASGQVSIPSSSDHNGRSVLLLIPLRLGQDHFNMQYAEGLKVTNGAYSIAEMLVVVILGCETEITF